MGIMKEETSEECYCGYTGSDHTGQVVTNKRGDTFYDGCTCFISTALEEEPTNMEEKPSWNMTDKEIIEKYYPTKATPPGYEPLSEEEIEENEWEWEGGEFDELIPWTFGSQEVDEEKFLVLLDAWNNHRNVISFTSSGCIPEKKEDRERQIKEGHIDDSYEYITFRNNKLWQICINPNMGLEYIEVIQELPDLYWIKNIKLKVEYEGTDTKPQGFW